MEPNINFSRVQVSVFRDNLTLLYEHYNLGMQGKEANIYRAETTLFLFTLC